MTKEGKQELALALLLWRDFKADNFDMTVVRQMYEMAEELGISRELGEMMPKVPKMKIEPL